MIDVSGISPDVPTQWSPVIDNEYLPLIPGTVFTYQGERDGEPEVDRVHVTRDTRSIMGVTCVVVQDSVFVSGYLFEATLDWYAQSADGDVWYFGEDTAEYDRQGHVISTEGTWLAGVDGAQPGIVMLAEPRVGDRYRQELAPGVAEDQARVMNLHARVDVPYGRFTECLKTREWTPLDPGVMEQKFYAENVGFVRAITVRGGDDYDELVSVTTE